MDRIRRMDGSQSGGRQGAAAQEQVLRVLPRDQPGGQRGGDRRAGHLADGGALDRGRPQAARLRHAVLHRRRAADREREADHEIPPADDRAGHRRRHRRAGARRHLFRRRRRGRPHRPAGCAIPVASSCWCRTASTRAARMCRCRSRSRRRWWRSQKPATGAGKVAATAAAGQDDKSSAKAVGSRRQASRRQARQAGRAGSAKASKSRKTPVTARARHKHRR